jgi:hypothetical protein
MAQHDIEIRRYLTWRKKAKGKPIPIRLYEIIYIHLTMLWSKMGKPPIKNALYKFVEREEYKEQITTCELFKKLINEIKSNPSDDGSGYYLPDSGEQISYENMKQLEKEKDFALKELSTNKIAKRYEVVFQMCKKYETWALMKKSQQAEDITKQESFENNPSLPLKIS